MGAIFALSESCWKSLKMPHLNFFVVALACCTAKGVFSQTQIVPAQPALCIVAGNELVTRAEAVQACEGMDGRLVSITDEATNDAVFELIKDLQVGVEGANKWKGAWIGATRSAGDGTKAGAATAYTWDRPGLCGFDSTVKIDDSPSVTTCGYANWAASEPSGINKSGKDETCVNIYPTQKNKDNEKTWNDSACDSVKFYVCEKPC